MIIPGTDGQKMSKSYGNVIDIFLPEKELKKQIMGIVTDSTPLEDPKDPSTCNVVTLYRLVARPEALAEMEASYRAGGYGYGHAKTALFEAILDRFADSRAEFDRLMAQPEAVHAVLRQGADKARPVAQATLARLRSALGF